MLKRGEQGKKGGLVVVEKADDLARVFAEKTGIVLEDARKMLQASVMQGNAPTAAERAEAERQFKETEKAYGGKPAWEKAKAAGKTKLNYGQWVQVRTHNFKTWFGDWEAAARQSKWKASIDRALDDNQWQNRTVLSDGFDADPSGKLSDAFGFKVTKQLLTPDDIRKSDKRHGEGKEHERDQIGLTHVDYIKALEVLRDPETFKRTTSNNGKPSAEFARKFEDVTIVVAEVETAEDGAVSVKSVWKKIPGRIHAGGTAYPNRTSDNTAGVDIIVHSDTILVNPDEVSKVVDPETGEPMVVYHGTDADFTVFDPATARQNADIPAFFFAASKEHARGYGGKIVDVFLSIRNPVENPSPANMNGAALRKAMGASGKDGAISYEGTSLADSLAQGDDPEFAAFGAFQIKSATGNTGTFDQNNPDIRYSSDGQIQALYHKPSGLIFLVGENTDIEASTGVVLHEVTHSQQGNSFADKVTKRANELINMRKAARADIRALLARVAGRMVAAGAARLDGVKASIGVPLEYEVQPSSGIVRSTPIDGAELTALRRAAAGIESPERGITFFINEEGRAIVTGPARVKVPARFQRFANEHGLTLVVRRAKSAPRSDNGRLGHDDTGAGSAMPIEYRESGAIYFGEINSDAMLDRTGKTRFSVTGQANQTDGKLTITDPEEAAPYIVEEVAREGRKAGYSAIDGKFMDWVDATFGKGIGNLIRDFVASIRVAMMQRGIAFDVNDMTIDDMMAYAQASMKKAAKGDVVGGNGVASKSVIKTDDYNIIQDPTREQALNLLRRSDHGEMRGLRDADGSLYIWDAGRDHHAGAAKQLGIDKTSAGRLMFNEEQLKAMPEGVFAGEPGYRTVKADERDGYSSTSGMTVSDVSPEEVAQFNFSRHD